MIPETFIDAKFKIYLKTLGGEKWLCYYYNERSCRQISEQIISMVEAKTPKIETYPLPHISWTTYLVTTNRL